MARILHLDDKEYERLIVREILLPEGHELESVATVEAAKDALANQQFELVICDGLVSYSFDGADFAQEIASKGQKALILSSSFKAERSGVVFLHKNDETDLPHVVAEILKA